MKTIIHVNRLAIDKNKSGWTPQPVLSIQGEQGEHEHADEIEILGPCKIVYRPRAPLLDGATVYITTDSEVRIIKP